MFYKDKLSELGITAAKTGKYTCPQCSATRSNKQDKCLSVTFGTEGVLYKCHNCDWSGIVFYREKYEVKKNYKRPELPKLIDSKQALYTYFEKRGILKETLDKYKVGINDKKEIIFPYYKHNELVNIKYRTNLGNGKKSFRQEADSEKTFFGMDLVTDFSKLVICEGEIDVLSLAEVGIESVSVPQGASENKLECIDNCWEWLQKFESYVIAVDNDDAGDKLKANLKSRLGEYKCKIVNFKQFKDSNEVLQSEDGRNILPEFINNAELPKSDGIVSFYDCIDEILDFYHNGYTKGYSTGWSNLDEIFTIKTSYLMIVTGIPSRGKSFFVDNLLFNLTKSRGLKHLIASFENTNENHFARIASMHQEKRFAQKEEWTNDELSDSIEFVSENFYRFKIDRLWSVDAIIEHVEYAVKRYGIKTLTIDPYNRLNNDYKDREDKYIGNILAKLSMTAKKLDILIIFIAHPKKPDGGKIPSMYSISGSSDWYNMADYGIIIHRERTDDRKLEDKMKVIVQKVKDFNLGDPSGGEVILKYNPAKFKLFAYTDEHEAVDKHYKKPY